MENKVYIVKHNTQLGTTEYKRYKCIDGFSKNKSECWKFSKAGAAKIIERLKREYVRNIKNLEFYTEVADD